MSYYRQSPNKSPYKSGIMSAIEEKQLLEEELNLKKILRLQGQNRRLVDELSIVRLKLRKIEQLEDKYDAVLKQNSLLAQSNEQLTNQLTQKRYELERIRVGGLQVQERQIFKNTQLIQLNKNLEVEIQMLKKERIQNSKVYEDHISKLEMILQEKVQELETLGVRYDKITNEKESGEIKFEQEKNKLKNEIARTSYQKDRQMEINKQKQYNEKVVEIQNLKRNHASQILILEDQIQKLKKINEIKTHEFEGQLIQNRNLKISYQEELKKMAEDNDALRLRMAKLEELNRSEVQNIEVKYNNIQHEGTSSLKQQHGNEIRLLLGELDRLKWLLNDKNAEIQQLVKEKRDLRISNDEKQQQLSQEIQVLKNKLQRQHQKSNQDKHELMEKISNLENKQLRESENYHERVNHFTNQIEELEGETKKREANYERSKRQWELIRNQLFNQKQQLKIELAAARKTINDKINQLDFKNKQFDEYRSRTDKEKQKLSKLYNEYLLKSELLQQKLDSSNQSDQKQKNLLRQQLQSYKRTNAKLDAQLKELQAKYTSQLGELSTEHRKEIERLEQSYKLRIAEIQRTFSQLRGSLENQVKLARGALQDKERQLYSYIQRYDRLKVHFENPSKWVQFDPRGNSSIYEALKKQKQSAVKIY